MAKKEEREIVVIGAGPAGYAAAFKASDLGLNVTLIGKEAEPGGTCLHEGCIPVKTLVEVLKIKEEAAKAKDWGMEFTAPKIDVKSLLKWKDETVKKLTEGIGVLSKDREIEYIRGTATFLSEHEIEVNPHEGDQFTLVFEKVILATGSVPKELPKAKFDKKRIINSTTALELKKIPETMLVVGGGFVGPSLGSIYASLGSKVSLAESTSGILSWLDQDLADIFNKQNVELFTDIFLETMVEEAIVKDDKVKVSFKNKEKSWEEEYDLVLVAQGREPNTSQLQLDKAGVEIDEEGFVQVDESRKTSNENIYAIGDITEKPFYANKASHEGQLVAEVLAGKETQGYSLNAIPSIIATPLTEIAWCGLSEVEAKKQEVEIKVVKFPWSASGRAASMGIRHGLTKLIIDKESGRIVGGGVVGEKAGSLIAEIAFAIEMSASAEDVALTMHPHPTLSETIMEAAESYFGSPTHLAGKKND
tara:strand:- start:3459 stop:4886 length:1428 start_codon:yes stop_codon:yes gene_type:complete